MDRWSGSAAGGESDGWSDGVLEAWRDGLSCCSFSSSSSNESASEPEHESEHEDEDEKEEENKGSGQTGKRMLAARKSSLNPSSNLATRMCPIDCRIAGSVNRVSIRSLKSKVGGWMMVAPSRPRPRSRPPAPWSRVEG